MSTGKNETDCCCLPVYRHCRASDHRYRYKKWAFSRLNYHPGMHDTHRKSSLCLADTLDTRHTSHRCLSVAVVGGAVRAVGQQPTRAFITAAAASAYRMMLLLAVRTRALRRLSVLDGSSWLSNPLRWSSSAVPATVPCFYPRHTRSNSGSLYNISSRRSNSTTTSSPSSVPFHYPRAQDLFQRITATLHTVEEVRKLQQEMYILLGRPLRDNEFYYDGFGPRRNKGGQSASGAESTEAAAAVEVRTTFDVRLVGFDATAKIKVIKEIRSLAGLGLKEAKELVESAPCTIQKGVKTEAAEEIMAKLVAIGAQMELA